MQTQAKGASLGAVSDRTPGQLAYEEDVRRDPNYITGDPRLPWDRIGDIARESWERNPTPRASVKQREMTEAERANFLAQLSPVFSSDTNQ